MRKALNIFLVFLLLFSTTGVAVSKHFCGEILQSITINANTPAESCCDSQDMDDDCCNNQLSLEKAEEVQLSQFNLNFAPSAYLISYLANSLHNIALEVLDNKIPIASFDAPPLIGQDIFILDQSFLL